MSVSSVLCECWWNKLRVYEVYCMSVGGIKCECIECAV